MLYVMASNDDRHTPAGEVMWSLELRDAATVYLNFRSSEHVTHGLADTWLRAGGWARDEAMLSTRSTGEPRGPYAGPVYAKRFARGGRVALHGSNYWEGTYFVFVQPAVGAAA